MSEEKELEGGVVPPSLLDDASFFFLEGKAEPLVPLTIQTISSFRIHLNGRGAQNPNAPKR
jgi:hypothetical protein